MTEPKETEEHETEQVNLRVTPSKLALYRELAKRDNRKLANWMKHMIDSAIAQRGTP